MGQKYRLRSIFGPCWTQKFRTISLPGCTTTTTTPTSFETFEKHAQNSSVYLGIQGYRQVNKGTDKQNKCTDR